MVRKHKQIVQALCDAVKGSPLTPYRISQMSGTSQAQLSRMVKRSNLPRLDTAEKIAEAMGYHIVLKPIRGKPSRPRKRQPRLLQREG